MNPTSTKLLATAAGKASLKRPQFSAGLLLQDNDLTQIVDYVRDMTRLLFRTMLGCGVMCGFEVAQSQIYQECYRKLKIDVEKGVALDCRGDLIELPSKKTVEIDLPCEIQIPTDIWVVIRRCETHCEPRDVMCSPQDDDISSIKTRICDSYEIKILDSDPAAGCCPCPKDRSNAGTIEKANNCCAFIASDEDPCYKQHYKGACDCECICDCIVLAKMQVELGEGNNLIAKPADYSVRRFVRPVLMRDPLVPYKEASDAGRRDTENSPAGRAPTPPVSASRTSRPQR